MSLRQQRKEKAIRIAVYINPKTYKKLDSIRGNISKSKFSANIIDEYFTKIKENSSKADTKKDNEA